MRAGVGCECVGLWLDDPEKKAYYKSISDAAHLIVHIQKCSFLVGHTFRTGASLKGKLIVQEKKNRTRRHLTV